MKDAMCHPVTSRKAMSRVQKSFSTEQILYHTCHESFYVCQSNESLVIDSGADEIAVEKLNRRCKVADAIKVEH